MKNPRFDVESSGGEKGAYVGEESFRNEAINFSSADPSVTSSITEHDNNSKGDNPEELIRQEDQTISVLRVVVAILLIAASGSTAALTYHTSANTQEKNFERSFYEIETKIIDSFLEETKKKVWNARTLSAGISVTIITSGLPVTNLSIPYFDELTEEIRLVSHANRVVWSPFLRSVEDLETFTAHAIDETDGGVAKISHEPPCWLCGTPELVFTNPRSYADIPGVGQLTCADWEGAGAYGSIGTTKCPMVMEAVSGSCQCGLPNKDRTQIPERNTSQGIWKIGPDGLAIDDIESPPPYNPIWNAGIIGTTKGTFMYNQMSEPIRQRALKSLLINKAPSFSETFVREGPYYENYVLGRPGEIGTLLLHPVFDPREDEHLVGSVILEILWAEFLSTVFPPDSNLVDVVVTNSCGQTYTFNIENETNKMTLVGEGDHHDRQYTRFGSSSTYEDYDDIIAHSSGGVGNLKDLSFCRYRFSVYPKQELRDKHVTEAPLIYTVGSIIIFLFTSLVFLAYDAVVRRRQRRLLKRATTTGNIVSSLFPKTIRERLYDGAMDSSQSTDPRRKGKTISSLMAPSAHLEKFFSGNDRGNLLNSDPIADFFPAVTVMFIDIAGFTAWSSERDPIQVFRLLEAIYQTFDEIAHRCGVFKVETIGDSYVAVAGVPQPRANHALVMAKFAEKCLRHMTQLVVQLETALGPSTGELRARCGLHSGPVTAGVLRGEKARFQLFGDTVNTASRIERTGEVDRIHCTKETAGLLIAAGKGSWVTQRVDPVTVKGKGEMQTFWVDTKAEGRVVTSSFGSSSFRSLLQGFDSSGNDLDVHKKNDRLVSWNTEVLYSLLEKVVLQRPSPTPLSQSAHPTDDLSLAETEIQNRSGIVFDEITELVALPPFTGGPTTTGSEFGSLWPTLGGEDNVKTQLKDFVSCISDMYHDVPFHNFEHASHVTMSAGKLMKRIVTPRGVDYDQDVVDVARDVHDLTYGISGDPLMQFGIAFAALIHDVDHSGLPNAELVRMGTTAATKYKGKSIAEQNSVDVAWNVLMSPEYDLLRRCIYTTTDELNRFRQLVVNAVMATDIADKGLQALRRERWTRAFEEMDARTTTTMISTPPSSSSWSTATTQVDRKASIVFEYIIQASDVSHTMQHWQTYVKWNRRLFFERYTAYLEGHEDEDPAAGWYEGEIGFFDYYIIPLAKRLEECGVFGVSHYEYLNYATNNRHEWEVKGREVVRRLHEDAIAELGVKSSMS